MCHDACNADWPPAMANASGPVNLIVVNPPWGNKIGNPGDGNRIVRHLAAKFGGSACTIVAMVSWKDFDLLAEFDEQSQQWQMKSELPVDPIAKWQLTRREDVGSSRKRTVLAVLCTAH